MKRLLRFALPFLGSALIQQLYSTTDLIFAGWFLGSSGMAAIGGTSIIATVIIGIFTGLGVGISTHVARLFGEGNKEKIKQAISTAFMMIVLLSLPFILVLEVCSPFILNFMHIPSEIFDLSLVYLRIYVVSILSITMYNVIAGILRAMDESLMPMYAQLVGGIFNVCANYLLIVRFRLGVFGAGLATLISQSVAAVAVFIFFLCLLKRRNFHGICLSCNVYDIKEILKVGIPAAIQTSIITISNFFVQSDVNTLGMVSIAAFAAYYKVENFIYYPIMAVGQANAVIAAQDYGRKDMRTMFRGIRSSLVLGLLVSVILTVVLLIFRRNLFLLFGNDKQVISLGMQMVMISFPFYFLYLIMEVLSGTIRSTGDAFLPMMCIVINMCPVRLLVLHVLMSRSVLLPKLVMLYPITWAATVGMLIIAYIWWKKNRICMPE